MAQLNARVSDLVGAEIAARNDAVHAQQQLQTAKQSHAEEVQALQQGQHLLRGSLQAAPDAENQSANCERRLHPVDGNDKLLAGASWHLYWQLCHAEMTMTSHVPSACRTS